MNRKLSFLIPALAICMFSHFMSFGWGKDGHQIVAQIAGRYMDKHTLELVNKYLNGMSLADAGTWMDDVKGDAKYSYLSPWHFVNVEKGKYYVPNTHEVNCINEINNAYRALKFRSSMTDEEIKFNLLILFHLWGDLHQPLHAGYASDKGGNNVSVKFRGTTTTNLHTVWDSEIIKDQRITLNKCDAMSKLLSGERRSDIKRFDNISAMKQSQALLTEVYNIRGGNIDAMYIERNAPTIELQLLCGGLRLAAMLDDIFKGK